MDSGWEVSGWEASSLAAAQRISMRHHIYIWTHTQQSRSSPVSLWRGPWQLFSNTISATSPQGINTVSHKHTLLTHLQGPARRYSMVPPLRLLAIGCRYNVSDIATGLGSIDSQLGCGPAIADVLATAGRLCLT